MRLALYEPDIPQNAGALMRLGACLGVAVDVIEPCGFQFSDKGLRRAGMDYIDLCDLTRHSSWRAFLAQRGEGRLILLSSHATFSYLEFAFRTDDTLVLGRESAGVPQHVHDAVDARLRIPLRPALRSLNVASAAAMVVGEALRQTGASPR